MNDMLPNYAPYIPRLFKVPVDIIQLCSDAILQLDDNVLYTWLHDIVEADCPCRWAHRCQWSAKVSGWFELECCGHSEADHWCTTKETLWFEEPCGGIAQKLDYLSACSIQDIISMLYATMQNTYSMQYFVLYWSLAYSILMHHVL